MGAHIDGGDCHCPNKDASPKIVLVVRGVVVDLRLFGIPFSEADEKYGAEPKHCA